MDSFDKEDYSELKDKYIQTCKLYGLPFDENMLDGANRSVFNNSICLYRDSNRVNMFGVESIKLATSYSLIFEILIRCHNKKITANYYTFESELEIEKELLKHKIKIMRKKFIKYKKYFDIRNFERKGYIIEVSKKYETTIKFKLKGSRKIDSLY